MSTRAELHDLVRQLRSELEWAVRIGAVDEPLAKIAEPAPPRLPPEPVLPVDRAALLRTVCEELGDCTRCKLSGLGRTQIVFGVGNASAELMFIGEGPGAQEDLKGEPFVGDAGQLLNKIIQGMGLQRAEVYIANCVKCRPPQNRDPEPDEIGACEPFLKKQIAVVKPKVIVTLGKYASQTILRTSTPITRLRGKWGTYEGTPVMPTYHPAYLLRNPEEKRPVWEDMKQVLSALGREVPQRGEK
jgi:uracil-DNA glycosylase